MGNLMLRKCAALMVSAIFFILFPRMSLQLDGQSSVEEARKKLMEMELSYDPGTFVDRVREDDARAVNFFLICGMNPNLKNKNGLTVLMVAAARGATDTARLLVSKGADVNARTRDGMTALMFAARAGKLETVKFLCKNNADAEIKNKDGKTARDLAIEGNHVEVAEFLRVFLQGRQK